MYEPVKICPFDISWRQCFLVPNWFEAKMKEQKHIIIYYIYIYIHIIYTVNMIFEGIRHWPQNPAWNALACPSPTTCRSWDLPGICTELRMQRYATVCCDVLSSLDRYPWYMLHDVVWYWYCASLRYCMVWLHCVGDLNGRADLRDSRPRSCMQTYADRIWRYCCVDLPWHSLSALAA